MSAYPKLFSPLRVGPVELPSRIIMGSMHTGLEAHPDGPARMAAFYGARARGGAALIVTGGWSPDPAGCLGPHPNVFADAKTAQAHRAVTDAVHAGGGRILLQLLHAGRYGQHEAIVAPSPLRAPINSITPREMSAAEIEATIAAYARSAALSAEAGYDGVEVMGSEGYLITQFLARRTNRREDEWGGTRGGRARFAIKVVEAVRAALGPDRILMFRLSALDLVEDAQSSEDICWLARKIEAAGADILDTGIGWHEARIPTISQAVPRGAFTEAVRQVREAVAIPVVASNRINTPDLAEAVIARGDADAVLMARPFLADAELVAKARAGEARRINSCIACNQACLDHLFEGKVASCLVNPLACNETEIVISPARSPKRVAVVGAGPAGLAAATTLAERGHDVALFEGTGRIGGQLALACVVPGKGEFHETLRYFENRIAETGVDLRLSTEADAAMLAGFDEVVIAAGVVPRRGVIPGEDHASVVSYADILAGRHVAGKRVAVIGAGGIGFDIALYLAEPDDAAQTEPAAFREHWGIGAAPRKTSPVRQVTMLQRSPGAMGRSLGKTTGWVHRIEAARAGIEQISGVTYQGIDDAGLHILAGGEKRLIEADTIVLCAGQEERRDLAAELGMGARPVHVIGGARLAANVDAKRAIDEGVRLAATI
ncbi:MAG TPA: NADPH-dependent 2,4-dienoyl-CoA reductase [Hyphomicrobiales bacterium]|nr:NADPH-dependent 2,4-dienoyl-CoA reductase [Rhodobiaceae bacterium]HXK53102.1 NADPH-dependent 2,4-dienoyl-CoA reductase [Hyphomicrobiales bacterium]